MEDKSFHMRQSLGRIRNKMALNSDEVDLVLVDVDLQPPSIEIPTC